MPFKPSSPAGSTDKRPAVRLGSRRLPLPRSPAARILVGVGLILGGLLGFLPVLGFWMVPLGVVVLAYDLPEARRLSRRIGVWWGRRWGGRSGDGTGNEKGGR